MLDFIRQCLQPFSAEKHSADGAAVDIKLLTVLLLFEVVLIDDCFDDKERNQLESSISNLFDLEESLIDELIDKAYDEHHSTTSLHAIVKEINEHLEEAEKIKIIEHLWRIAFADGHLDKFEEHIIRRIADLLYVRHVNFIQAKHIAKESM